jgi:hypothetical protein
MYTVLCYNVRPDVKKLFPPQFRKPVSTHARRNSIQFTPSSAARAARRATVRLIRCRAGDDTTCKPPRSHGGSSARQCGDHARSAAVLRPPSVVRLDGLVAGGHAEETIHEQGAVLAGVSTTGTLEDAVSHVAPGWTLHGPSQGLASGDTRPHSSRTG